MGRNTLSRPWQFNLSVSFAKDNRLGEGRNLEFRAEFFNFLNHPNFGAPNASILRNAARDLNPNVGRIINTSTTMRQTPLGLKLTFQRAARGDFDSAIQDGFAGGAAPAASQKSGSPSAERSRSES